MLFLCQVKISKWHCYSKWQTKSFKVDFIIRVPTLTLKLWPYTKNCGRHMLLCKADLAKIGAISTTSIQLKKGGIKANVLLRCFSFHTVYDTENIQGGKLLWFIKNNSLYRESFAVWSMKLLSVIYLWLSKIYKSFPMNVSLYTLSTTPLGLCTHIKINPKLLF